MALGLIGKKLGMTQVFSPQGELIPVTVIQTGPCTVVQVKTAAADGYAAVQLGFGQKKPERATKAYRNHCKKTGESVFEVLREFRVDGATEFTAGQTVQAAEVFKPGDRVDVSGTTKGRGYSGVISATASPGFPAATARTSTSATAARSETDPIRAASSRGSAWPGNTETSR